MRLDDIWQMYKESDPHDWNDFVLDGISYFQSVVPDYGNGMTVREHSQYAVYKEDVRLAIAWGYSDDDHDDRMKNDDFDWMPKVWGDPRRSSMDLFWDGMLVDRRSFMVVNNGHAYLPFPHVTARDHVDGPWTEYLLRSDIDELDVLNRIGSANTSEPGFTLSQCREHIFDHEDDVVLAEDRENAND